MSINGFDSEGQSVKCGVPQRSILGPLLIWIHTKELTFVDKSTFFVCFADVTIFLISQGCWNIKVNIDLKKYSTWILSKQGILDFKNCNFYDMWWPKKKNKQRSYILFLIEINE